MLFTIEFWNTEKYLPTKRHRKLRARRVKCSTVVDVKELEESEFPVAFIVNDYQSIYENAKSYYDFNGAGDYRMFSEEIRIHGEKLYKPVRITHGSAISLHFETLDYVQKELKEPEPWWIGGEEFTEKSIIKESDSKVCKEAVQKRAEHFVIHDGKVWKTCGEPMYVINTFGLGHNHGGTGFFITDSYNPNIGNKNYFNALEREQAIAWGKRIAINRGDTASVEGMGKDCSIEVLMPEMVRRNPQKDHGNGDSFMNSLEELISGSNSTTEAGILCTAKTFMELKK